MPGGNHATRTAAMTNPNIPTPAQPNAFSFRLRIPGILHVSATLRWFAQSWFRRRRSV
jgi:hypothetical protein